MIGINEYYEESEYEKISYDINSYIKDEIRTGSTEKNLVLNFEAEKYDYITLDILSYIVGEIQYDFCDYKCIGVIK